MGRCNNAAVLAKIGQKKIDNNAEISFSVRRELPDCRKIDAKKAVGATLPYNRYLKPVNRFECDPVGCSTYGTATVATAAKYFAEFDATEFAAGVITFYAKPTEYPTTVTVTVASESALTNADVYTVTLTQDMEMPDGFVPVLIDLSKTPTSEVGTGWAPSASGAYINIAVDKEAGISTITVLDSIEDFETVATVKMACISSAGGSYDLSAVEEACREAELDDSLSTLSFPITCNLITPNWYLMNPMYEKGEQVEGFKPVTAKKTVEAYTVGGKDYGRVIITDAHDTECRFWAVQIADECTPFESNLAELSIPFLADIDEGHFIVLRGAEVSVIVNAAHVGEEVLIAYPQKADIEEFVFGTDEINSVRTSMTVPYCFEGNVEEVHVYDNVLVTGFPFGLSNSATEVSFTITVTKKDGKFFRVQRFV